MIIVTAIAVAIGALLFSFVCLFWLSALRMRVTRFAGEAAHVGVGVGSRGGEAAYVGIGVGSRGREAAYFGVGVGSRGIEKASLPPFGFQFRRLRFKRLRFRRVPLVCKPPP